MRGLEALAELDNHCRPAALADASVLRDALQLNGIPFDHALSDLGDPMPEAYGLGVEEFVFPNLGVLGLPPADWFHRAHRVEIDWTHHFEARFWLVKTVAQTFERVGVVLSERLGPCRTAPGTRVAAFGSPLLQIRARYENPESALRSPRYRENPELLDCVTVDLYSPLRTVLADPDMLERVRAAERLPLLPKGARANRRHQHVHPTPFEEEDQGIWIDGQALGVSGRHLSVAYPRTQALSLKLTEVSPARGPGSADLGLSCGGGVVALASSPQTEGLRDRAEALSEQLGLPISRVAFAND